jgi:UTP:GlnB (protein PII) uridylyltransferase
VHLAKITTHVGHVLDVFYVTDSAGHKIVDPERVRHIEEEVLRCLRAHAAEEPAEERETKAATA